MSRLAAVVTIETALDEQRLKELRIPSTNEQREFDTLILNLAHRY